jgi:hypothetical protein
VTKLILMSIMIATLAIPVRAARLRDPRRGLRRMVFQLLVFNAAWFVAVKYIVLRFMTIPQLQQ